VNIVLDIAIDVEVSVTEFNILEMLFLGAPLIERMDAKARALGNLHDGEQMIHVS